MGSGCKHLAGDIVPELERFQANLAGLAEQEDMLVGHIGLARVGRMERLVRAGNRLVEVVHMRTDHMKAEQVPDRIHLVDMANAMGPGIDHTGRAAEGLAGRRLVLVVGSRIRLAEGQVSRRLRPGCIDRMDRSF